MFSNPHSGVMLPGLFGWSWPWSALSTEQTAAFVLLAIAAALISWPITRILDLAAEKFFTKRFPPQWIRDKSTRWFQRRAFRLFLLFRSIGPAAFGIVGVLLAAFACIWLAAMIPAAAAVSIAAVLVVVTIRDARMGLRAHLTAARESRIRLLEAEAQLDATRQILDQIRDELKIERSVRLRLDKLATLHSLLAPLCIAMITEFKLDQDREALDAAIHNLIGVFSLHACHVFAQKGGGIRIAVFRPDPVDGEILTIWNHRDVVSPDYSDFSFYVGPELSRRSQECGLAGDSFLNNHTHIVTISENLGRRRRHRFRASNSCFKFFNGPNNDPGFRSVMSIPIPASATSVRAVLCIDSDSESLFEGRQACEWAEGLSWTIAVPILIYDDLVASLSAKNMDLSG